MATTTNCPEAILTSIPWYPDGLTPEECGAVEAHAADCRECRAELAFVRGDEEPAIELPDPERVYARVLELISGDSDTAVRGISAARRAVGHAARQASLAAGILVAVCSGMLTTGAIWFVRVAPTYETAAAGAPSVDAGGPRLEVVFREDASADQIRARLREVGATVISGPTQLGVYRLRLAPGADVSATIKRLRGEGRGVATFAEPSRG
jgi:Fervidolysin N-terminal prodomain/Putative zinc-finger